MSLNDLEPEVFLNRSHGVSIVDGMTLDHVNRRLFFTNMGGITPPHHDQPVYWSRIESIGLDRGDRYTLVYDVDKPRGVTLDIYHG